MDIKDKTEPVWIEETTWMGDVVSFLNNFTPDEVSTNIQADVNFIKKRCKEAKDFVLQCKDRGYNEIELMLCFSRYETNKEQTKRLKSESLNKEVKRLARLERKKNEKILYEKLKKKFEGK